MFHFTIRDLLWLTVVVALALAWWADRSQFAASNAESVRMVGEQLKREYEQATPAKKIDITVNGGDISLNASY